MKYHHDMCVEQVVLRAHFVFTPSTSVLLCSEQILQQKKRALQAKEALEQEQLRNVEADKQAREAERNQAKARRIAEAQRAQQRAALDLEQKTTYFKVGPPASAGVTCFNLLIFEKPFRSSHNQWVLAHEHATMTKFDSIYVQKLCSAAAYHHQALISSCCMCGSKTGLWLCLLP